jgi:hypothetical protein
VIWLDRAGDRQPMNSPMQGKLPMHLSPLLWRS